MGWFGKIKEQNKVIEEQEAEILELKSQLRESGERAEKASEAIVSLKNENVRLQKFKDSQQFFCKKCEHTWSGVNCKPVNTGNHYSRLVVVCPECGSDDVSHDTIV